MMQLDSVSQAARWLRGRVTGELYADSRQVKKGDGFVAWPGSLHDGRKFVVSALGSGATACLVERDGSQVFDFGLTNPVETQSVASFTKLRAATGPIAAAFYHDPSKQIRVVAVTGTNGKTTTAWWFSHLIAKLPVPLGALCGHIGTLGAGVVGGPMAQLQPTGLTTPDPVLLQKKLRQFADAGVACCVLEASSIGLEEKRLSGTRIQLAIFTNFTHDHLDYHGSMQAYWEAKKTLFLWPGLQSAVINIDDAKGKELVETLRASAAMSVSEIWTVSCVEPARLQAADIRSHLTGLSFTVIEGGQKHRVVTRMIGLYNVSNLLCVIAAARALGVGLDECLAICADLPPAPGRMESYGGGPVPLVVVDYAHTPDALQQVLSALREIAKVRAGRVICVFGCGGDRDAGKRPIMGQVAEKLADLIVVTTDNPRSEDPAKISDAILAGIQKHQIVQVEPDRQLAITNAVLQATVSDVVLVAGKGHEQYQEAAGLRKPFSDQYEVKAALLRREYHLPLGKVSR